MTGALSIYTPQEQVALAGDVWPLANRLSETEFVPKALKGRPEAVLACMLKGSELGIPLMQSLSAIHVIEGRPTMSSELMRAVVQSRGHTIVVEESTSTRCIIKGRRNGETEWQRFTFTRDDAERGGLLGKDVWKRWPQSMLLARASGLLCRAVFADCLAGISYTLEELNDGSDTIQPDVAVVIADQRQGADTPRRTAPRKSRARAAKSSEPPAVESSPPPRGDLPPLPGEDDIVDADVVTTTADRDVPRPGPQQIAIALRQHHVASSPDRGRAIRQIVGREVQSSKELTADEVAQVLEAVNSLPVGAPFLFDDEPTDPLQEEPDAQ
jgi:hypothetical protein